MTGWTHRKSLLLTVATASLSVAVATAQEDVNQGQDDETIEQIVVTATRVTRGIMEVPISIEAFSQDKIDRQGLRSVDDIANFTPGVNIVRFASTGANISIRGISSNTGARTTGIYIDDTPVQMRSVGSQPRTVYPNTFDIERVEVLRGPQGTLFGAGAQGGAVRFITRKASLEDYSLYSRNELAFTDGGEPSHENGIAVGGPIIRDKLGFRISGYYRKDGGFVDRARYLSGATQEEDSNDLENSAVRASLRYQLTDNITVTPSFNYQEIYSHDINRPWEGLSDPDDGAFVVGSIREENNEDRFYLPALDIVADLGSVQVTSNTSYFRRDEDGIYDYAYFDLASFAFLPPGAVEDFYSIPDFNPTSLNGNDQYNWNQEFRISNNDPDGSFSWLFGLYYGSSKTTTYQSVQNEYFLNYFGIPGLVSDFGVPAYDEEITTRERQISGFGEVSWEIFDGLRVTAGARYSDTRFESEGSVTTIFNVLGGVPPTTVNALPEQTEDPITPKFGISYEWDGNMVYATAAKGFRIGGPNRAIPPTAPCIAGLAALGYSEPPTGYSSDSVWSYEIGSKNMLFDNRVSVAASAYSIEWSDIIQDVGEIPGCPYALIGNLGDATSTGFDVQLDWRVTDGFNVLASVGYNDAEYDETVRIPGATDNLVTGGHTLGGAPWTVTFSGNYETMIASYPAFFRADYNFRSRNDGLTEETDPLSVTSYDPQQRPSPELRDVRLRAGLYLNDAVEIAVFVNNLLDESPKLFRNRPSAAGFDFEFTAVRPRTVGLSAIFSF